ncbi:hypothetical protein [Maribellus mangrovi]|uniref:hypothetical protein n=1 Tax=Maribellus mangrovi TaxID=3133146 RepID=UPI0030ED097A
MKKLFFLAVALCCSISLFAQTDFSGTWKLNNSKSKLGEQFSMAPKTIVVAQKGNDISVEKHSEFQGNEFTSTDKYTLDGKECVNKGFMDTEKKSKAVWDGEKKSLTVTSKIPMQGETMTVTEIFSMKDGAMVIQSKASSSYGDLEETQVFDKK